MAPVKTNSDAEVCAHSGDQLLVLLMYDVYQLRSLITCYISFVPLIFPSILPYSFTALRIIKRYAEADVNAISP